MKFGHKHMIWSFIAFLFYLIVVPVIGGYLISSKPYGFEANLFYFTQYWLWGGLLLLTILIGINIWLWKAKK